MNTHNWIRTDKYFLNGDYMYECTICNYKVWIPSYSKIEDLEHRYCIKNPLSNSEVRKIFDLPFISDNKAEKISDILLKGDFNKEKIYK